MIYNFVVFNNDHGLKIWTFFLAPCFCLKLQLSSDFLTGPANC